MTTCRSDTGPPPRRHRGVSDPPLLLPIAAATMWEIRPSTLRNNPGNRPRIYMGYNKRQRRLYAGLEALKLGHGGDRRIADLLGLDPGTVARGRKQLLAGDVQRDRVRRPGGGRPALKKKRPT